jgi:hypothetical protein
VWAAYSGLERSGGRAAAYTLVLGVVVIAGNWFVGETVRFASWNQFELVGIAAAVGAFVGIGTAVLAWEPDHSTTIPPVESEKEELDDMMSDRQPHTGGES